MAAALDRSDMRHYRKAGKMVDVSVGESVRILRELQELSQNELAERTGIPQFGTVTMKKAKRDNGPTFEARVAARKFEDLHLVVPKAVANRFRQVAKKSRISTSTLFEEMVATYANGTGVDEEK